jgi:hypothetical protein
MSEVLKIFLGADRYGYDFPELERLRIIAEKEGFHSFRNTINLTETWGEFRTTQEVIIRGGYCGYCVAHSVDYFLKLNTKSIVVDLPNCRIFDGDNGSNGIAFERRKRDVLLGMRVENRKDNRVVFIES